MPAAGALPDAWVTEVLDFWFGELPRASWFEQSDAVDATIRSRFETVLASVAAKPISEALANPATALATVIILDQFPRNIFRGTSRAFATDPLAIDVARQAISHGFDRELDPPRKLFLYLPFEHSENLEDQARSVALMSSLGDPEWARYAVAHKRVIDRFGRFPHRNAILGRGSTAAEEAFLREPGSSF